MKIPMHCSGYHGDSQPVTNPTLPPPPCRIRTDTQYVLSLSPQAVMKQKRWPGCGVAPDIYIPLGPGPPRLSSFSLPSPARPAAPPLIADSPSPRPQI
ncbi:hypothetical protein DPEC_G00242750 [Dallia pectoralis]|uniref:Uncharacterized protein n=1 Tax=Dallia pectoralis TaxID=75939 RepID=A0ACC2FVK2_DALPE|nr:hypothetical protein DPEC_G00242750 [Dallia pectoralis]